MPVWSILITPLATAGLCFLIGAPTLICWVSVLGSLLSFGVCGFQAWSVLTGGPLASSGLRLDALGAYLALIVSGLSLSASLASGEFMQHEAESEKLGVNSWRAYYGLLHLFVTSMLLVPIANNLGIMWVAVEATTLSSAFLVGFHRHRHSVEAAWKYVILCSVGIAFALFGTILLYYAGVRAGNGHSLDWTAFMESAPRMDPKIVKLGFLFAALGYGTKAGLAPMHTWLPDAHSQAPSPVSSLLSGVLIKCSIYAILRFHIIAARSLGFSFSSKFLLALGLLSLIIATPFILIQRNFKRLLAYHSIEHIGIISIGIGFGGFWGIYGALLHVLNHGLAKALLFLSAGNISVKYGSKRLHHVEGVLRVAPITGILFFAGAMALAGLPPFSLFLSEFMILASGFSSGHILASGLFIALVTVIFGGILYHAIPIAFGSPRKTLPEGDPSPCSLLPIAFMLFALVTLGVWIPQPMDKILRQSVEIVLGGAHG